MRGGRDGEKSRYQIVVPRERDPKAKWLPSKD